MIIIRSKKDDRLLEEKIMRLLAAENINAELLSVSSQNTFFFPGLTIDGSRRQIRRNGEKVSLTKTEYDLLLLLVSHSGEVLRKKDIFQAVWGRESENTLKVVANTISNLRRKIEPDPKNHAYIHTLNDGYMFDCKINK